MRDKKLGFSLLPTFPNLGYILIKKYNNILPKLLMTSKLRIIKKKEKPGKVFS